VRRNLYRALIEAGYKVPQNWQELSDVALRDSIIDYLSSDKVYTKELFSDVTELMDTYNKKDFARVMTRMTKKYKKGSAE
jgi:hypothetical protein